MRWFGGWVGGEQHVVPVPGAARLVATDDGALVWTVGEWADWEARTATAGRVRLLVIGACVATDAELAGVASALDAGAGPGRVLDLAGGGFVAVIRDGHRVWVVPDLAGTRPVFYADWAGGVVFASSPLPIADLLGQGVDAGWAAARLLCPMVPDLVADQSAFAGIQRTRPGHTLTLAARRRPVQRPIPSPTGTALPREAAVALREALVTAVDRRVALGPVSSDLSGGLDSSTLASLAARTSSNVLAVTYADPVSVNTDDLAHATACASTVPGLRHVIVAGDTSCLPFTGLAEAPLLDEPGEETVLAGRIRACLAPVLTTGSVVHLSGDGGDAVLSGPPQYVADLVRHPVALVREATGWARLRHRPAHRVLRAALRLAAIPYPRALRRAAGRLRAGGDPRPRGFEEYLDWCSLSPAMAWATPRSRRAVADRLEDLASRVPRWWSADRAAETDLWFNGATARLFEQFAHDDLGLRVHTPFLDNHVVRACWSIPVTDRTTVRATKPLLRTAMTGLVPDQVLARTTKGDYTACLYAGLRQNATEIRDLLADPILAELGLIDPRALRAAAERMITGQAGPLAALTDTIATEAWLRAINQPRPALWT